MVFSLQPTLFFATNLPPRWCRSKSAIATSNWRTLFWMEAQPLDSKSVTSATRRSECHVPRGLRQAGGVAILTPIPPPPSAVLLATLPAQVHGGHPSLHRPRSPLQEGVRREDSRRVVLWRHPLRHAGGHSTRLPPLPTLALLIPSLPIPCCGRWVRTRSRTQMTRATSGKPLG